MIYKDSLTLGQAQTSANASILGDCLGPFGRYATSLRAKNFAVMPAEGKTPLVDGFGNWRGPPSMATVNLWAQRHFDVDIVYLPWQTHVDRKGVWRVLVIDADDAAAVLQVEVLFGKTPGLIKTRRGKHFLYRIPVGDVPIIRELAGSNLKRLGINADLKYQMHDIAVCAHSRHEKDRSFIYTWDGCDESVIEDLPPFDLALLREVVEARSQPTPAVTAIKSTLRDPSPNVRAPCEYRDGSRKQRLNDYLVSQVAHCGSFEDLLACAHQLNEREFELHAKGLLDDAQVVARANNVWKQHLVKPFEAWLGNRSTAAAEARAMGAAGRNGSDAYLLLTLLRGEHSARSKLGKTFAISANAMAANKVLGDWSAARYRAARDLLLHLGGIVETNPYKHDRVPAQYSLVIGWQP